MSSVSSVYETEPMYLKDQGWFLNCVVSLQTDLRPEGPARGAEGDRDSYGQDRASRYGPRVLDLDILFYESEVVSEPGLEIPHPRIAERGFVLAPLEEIRPTLVHPVLGKTVSEMRAS